MRRASLIALLLGLSGCGVSQREYVVRVINAEKNDIPALVVVNNDWPDREKAVFSVPGWNTTVTVPLRHGRGELYVHAVRLGPDGKPLDEVPTQTTPSPYLFETREVYATDPKKMLFILKTNTNYGR